MEVRYPTVLEHPLRSRNPLADAFATFFAWFPILALLGAILLVLASGAVHLEATTYGSEHFLSNDASVDEFALSRDRAADTTMVDVG